MNVHTHIFADSTALVTTAAQNLVTAINDAIAKRGFARIVLTGGSNGIGILKALQTHVGEIDWTKVHLYFGDERFVAHNDPDRNSGQAQEAFLGSIPQASIYPIAASDEGLSIEQAASAYEELLLKHGEGNIPEWDVHLFGVGDEGHINSLFPHSSATLEKSRFVVAVTDSPKPPPERITLTFPAIDRARQTWFLVAGSGKATAVREAIKGNDWQQWPAAGAHGTEATEWYLDKAAASEL